MTISDNDSFASLLRLMSIDVLRNLKERHTDDDMVDLIVLELARRDEVLVPAGSPA